MKKKKILSRTAIENDNQYNNTYEKKNIIENIGCIGTFLPPNYQKGSIRKYTGTTELISGIFFSGVGYIVAGTGTLLINLTEYLAREIPNIPYYINEGLGPNTLSDAYMALQGAFVDAQYNGSIGAAVGLLGGSMAIVRLKSRLADLIESFFSKK